MIARHALQTSSRRIPLNYDALFQSGLSSLAKGDATQAIRIFEQLSNMNRQDARVRYQLALAYLLYAKTASRRGQPEGDRERREPAE